MGGKRVRLNDNCAGHGVTCAEIVVLYCSENSFSE